MKYRFPREVRLVAKSQFDKVFGEAQQKISSEVFTLFFCRNDVDYPRVGIIVSKRNVSKSAERNYFKRIIREHFRLTKNKLKNIDLVVFVNKVRRKLSKKELNVFLEKQFSKIMI